MKPYGAFVRIDEIGRDGLLHISEVRAEERVDDVEDVLRVKQPLFAKIISINNNKISLSLKHIDQVTGEDMCPDNREDKRDDFDYSGSSNSSKSKSGMSKLKNSLLPSSSSMSTLASGSSDPPLLFSIHQGTIFRLMEFGIFVAIDNFREHGLIHISQLRHFRVEKISDIYSEESMGDRVWVKVIGIQKEPRLKISLSLKFVNQQTGQDLDPSNSLLEAEQAFKQASQVKPGTGAGGSQATPSPLNIANNTLFCVRCGTVGHEESECPFFKDHRKGLAVAVASEMNDNGEAEHTESSNSSSEQDVEELDRGFLDSKFMEASSSLQPIQDSPSALLEPAKKHHKKHKKEKSSSKKHKKKHHRDSGTPKSRELEVQEFLAEAQRLRQKRKSKKATKDKKHTHKSKR